MTDSLAVEPVDEELILDGRSGFVVCAHLGRRENA